MLQHRIDGDRHESCDTLRQIEEFTMNRADYIRNGIKLSLIALLTVVMILCLSFEEVYGTNTSFFYLESPDLAVNEVNPETGAQAPDLNASFSGNNLESDYFESEEYRPFIGGESTGYDVDAPTTVPEPTTLLLLGMGLAGAGLIRKRRS